MSVLDDETRAALAQELTTSAVDDILAKVLDVPPLPSKLRNTSTSTAAVELAQEDDGPAEPPVASRDNHQTIQSMLNERGWRFPKGESSVPE